MKKQTPLLLLLVFTTMVIVAFNFGLNPILGWFSHGQEIDQIKEQTFREASEALQRARDEGVPLFSPNNFAKAEEFHQKALEDYEKGTKLKKIRKNLDLSLKYIEAAFKAAKLSRKTLGHLIKMSEEEKEIGAFARNRYFKGKLLRASDFEEEQSYFRSKVGRMFRDAAMKIEDGNMRSARSIAKDVEEEYQKWVIKVLEKVVLTDARKELKDIEGTLPKESFRTAKYRLDFIENYIESLKRKEFAIKEFFTEVQTQIQQTLTRAGVEVTAAELPDLVITDFWNAEGIIYYQIMNIGNAVATRGHHTTLFIDGRYIVSQLVDTNLKPGERWRGCFEYEWKCTPPEDNLKVCADYKNSKTEKDETNNFREESWKGAIKIISGPTVLEVSQNSAVISWETDENSRSLVKYGKMAGPCTSEKAGSDLVRAHSITLTRLEPSTTYHFVAQSIDLSGNTAESQSMIFETLPLLDHINPTVSIRETGVCKGIVKIAADADDNSGIERVEFFLNEEPIFTDYSFPFEFSLNTANYENGSYDLKAKAFDLSGKSSTDEYKIDIANIVDLTAPKVTITSPSMDKTIVSGKINVIASLSDDTGLAYVYFKVNGISEAFQPLPSHPTKETVTFEWDTTSVPKGTYTLAVEAYDSDKPYFKYGYATRQVIVNKVPPPLPPKLKVTHNVTRYGNYFAINMSVTNVGNQTTKKIEIQDYLRGFQPISCINKTPVYATYEAKFDTYKREWECFIKSHEDIPPGQSRTYTYFAVPVLIDSNPPKPEIGYSTGFHYDKDAQGLRIHDWVAVPVLKTWGGKTIPQAYDEAIKKSDYLIVTNPVKLSAFGYKQIYAIYGLLSDMAELGRYKNGVLGYTYDYSTTGLQKLIKPGGKWSSKLKKDWTSNGYLLLVGENEIIPAWYRKFGNLLTTKGDIMLKTDCADYPYANTYGKELKPELSIGRIIGNTPAYLMKPIQYSFLVARGEVGCGFDRSHAFLVSGYNKGLGGGADDIDFKSEINAVSSEISKKQGSPKQTLLHTPSYTKYDGKGKIDQKFTKTTILNKFFFESAYKDVIFLAGHGNWDHCDVINQNDINNNKIHFFKTTNPFVFISSCVTGRYPVGFGFTEALLNKGAAVVLSASEFGLGTHANISKKFYEKWDMSESIGLAVKQTKCSLGYSVSDKYWTGIYHVYGDPKFGQGKPETTSKSSSTALTQTSTSVSVDIPYYETTKIEGKDYVNIPNGYVMSIPERPLVPYYCVFYDYPKEYQIQNVVLTGRSEPVIATDLNIPKCVIGITESSSSGSLQLEETEWWPREVFEWTTFESPTTTTLAITTFPFYYNPLTTDVMFHKKYSFDIDYRISNVEITKLAIDRPNYELGDTVAVEIEFNDGMRGEIPPTGKDIVVKAVIKEAISDDVIGGLLLRTLKDFKGYASYSSEWNSAGFQPGLYNITVELKDDDDGTLLDKKIEYFRLGIASGEIINFSVTPKYFDIRDNVNMSLSFRNSGTVDLSGTIVIRIQNEDGEIVREFAHEITDLAPADTITFDETWDTSEVEDGSYHILGYILYNGMATDPRTARVSTNRQ